MDTRGLKKLADKYSLEQLESCIAQQLEKGENACEIIDESDVVMTELSEAAVVRELMDQGMRFSDALRELGRRIRSIYYKDDNAP